MGEIYKIDGPTKEVPLNHTVNSANPTEYDTAIRTNSYNTFMSFAVSSKSFKERKYWANRAEHVRKYSDPYKKTELILSRTKSILEIAPSAVNAYICVRNLYSSNK